MRRCEYLLTEDDYLSVKNDLNMCKTQLEDTLNPLSKKIDTNVNEDIIINGFTYILNGIEELIKLLD